MAENSAIEWTHHTFNPWIGCTKVGPGCDNCYAADLATVRMGVKWGAGEERRHTAASTWKQPRAWNRKAEAAGIRYRVFFASLADVFDNEVPAEWRAELFQLIRETPYLDWLLVTKRIGNAAKMAEAAGGWPGNIWLGISVVNQAEADRDIPKLLTTFGPRFRFLSMEPLLGPVHIRDHWLIHHHPGDAAIDWIIVGGESGPRARPMHPDWARSLRDQCEEAGVPFLFKQWGEWFPYGETDADGHVNVRTMGEKPGKWHEWQNAGGFSVRIGKKEAGRLLDGVQHDGYPGDAPAKAIEARRAETGTGSVHESAVPQAFAQNIPGDPA